MTHETKKKVKHETFANMRAMSLNCIRSTTRQDVADTWDGVMSALSYALVRGSSDEKSAVMLSAMKWMHAFCEQETCRKVEEAERLIESEKDAEHEEQIAAKASAH